MKYKNKKTGVVMEFTSPVNGGDWVSVGNLSTEPKAAEKEEKAEVVKEEVTHQVPEDLTKLTVEQLKELAESYQIKYTSKDTKNDLIELIAAELN